jgi:hypothetical protein
MLDQERVLLATYQSFKKGNTMSWEEMSRRSYPCPCGKGTYEEIFYSDDWNRSETRRRMLCPDCEGHYTYVESDYASQFQHKYFARARGWVRNNVLKEEKEEIARQVALLREKYEPSVRARLSTVRSKKELWEFVKPATKESLSQYYYHTKRLSLKEAIDEEVSRLFGTPKYVAFLEQTFKNKEG